MRTQQDTSNHAATGEVHKLQYIDILRGVAILGVMAVHSEQQIENSPPFVHWLFNYGQLGVQLFFVASAFTLCLSMRERNEKSAFNFYVRRFFRIAPLYYAGIVFYFLWRFLQNYLETGLALVPAQYNLLGVVENIFFVHGLDPRYSNFVVPGGWSISAEMCFYVIFPSLFLLQSRLGPAKFLKFSVLVIASSFAIQFVVIDVVEPRLIAKGLVHNTYTNDGFGFIYCTILNQINVFLIGMLAFQKMKQQPISNTKILLAFFLCCLSCYLLNTSEWKTGYNGFVYPILSAIAFSIFTLKLSETGPVNYGPVKLLAGIGQVSFSMYVLHFFVVDLLKLVHERSTFVWFSSPEVQLILLYLALVVVTYGAAKLSYAFLEKPAIEYGKRFIRL